MYIISYETHLGSPCPRVARILQRPVTNLIQKNGGEKKKEVKRARSPIKSKSLSAFVLSTIRILHTPSRCPPPLHPSPLFSIPLLLPALLLPHPTPLLPLPCAAISSPHPRAFFHPSSIPDLSCLPPLSYPSATHLPPPPSYPGQNSRGEEENMALKNNRVVNSPRPSSNWAPMAADPTWLSQRSFPLTAAVAARASSFSAPRHFAGIAARAR